MWVVIKCFLLISIALLNQHPGWNRCVGFIIKNWTKSVDSLVIDSVNRNFVDIYFRSKRHIWRYILINNSLLSSSHTHTFSHIICKVPFSFLSSHQLPPCTYCFQKLIHRRIIVITVVRLITSFLHNIKNERITVHDRLAVPYRRLKYPDS